MTVNDPEKNIPSTAVNAMSQVANEEQLVIHCKASQLWILQRGCVLICSEQGESFLRLSDVRVNQKYVDLGMNIFIIAWKV